MSFQLKTVALLFDKIAEKENKPLNRSNLLDIADDIKAVTNRNLGEHYLYRKYKSIKAAQKTGKTLIAARKGELDAIARYLGYAGYDDFERKMSLQPNPISPILLGCKGLWYSYVRCNSGRNDVLISPIEIYEHHHKIWLKMHGPTNAYEGELLCRGSCLFCALDSGKNKLLYMTYKIGECLSPKALVGTFCGMSTAGDPIAGREVLVKQTTFAHVREMSNLKIHLKDQEAVAQHLDWRLAQYFEQYNENYLKITNIGTFTLDDLVHE